MWCDFKCKVVEGKETCTYFRFTRELRVIDTDVWDPTARICYNCAHGHETEEKSERTN